MIPVTGRKIPALTPEMQDDMFETKHLIDQLAVHDIFDPEDPRCIELETFEIDPELSVRRKSNFDDLINFAVN